MRKSKQQKKAVEKPLRKCSFCDKTEKQIKELIAGPNNVFICNECIEICRDIIEEGRLKTLVYDTLVKLNKQMEEPAQFKSGEQ